MSGPQSTSTLEPAGSSRRRLLIVGAAVLVGVLIAGATLAPRLMETGAPSPTADPVSIAKFAATPAFAQMSQEQKASYLQAMRQNMSTLVEAAQRGELSREERIQATRNAFRAGAQIEAARYVALPAGPARKAHLDKLIDEQERLRQYSVRLTGNATPQIGGNPVEMKQFIESLAPEERIQLSQLAFDLFRRRLERGLPEWPFSGSGKK